MNIVVATACDHILNKLRNEYLEEEALNLISWIQSIFIAETETCCIQKANHDYEIGKTRRIIPHDNQKSKYGAQRRPLKIIYVIIRQYFWLQRGVILMLIFIVAGNSNIRKA